MSPVGLQPNFILGPGQRTGEAEEGNAEVLQGSTVGDETELVPSLAVDGGGEDTEGVEAAVVGSGGLQLTTDPTGHTRGAEESIEELAAIAVKQTDVPLLDVSACILVILGNLPQPRLGVDLPHRAGSAEETITTVIPTATGQGVNVTNVRVRHDWVSPANTVVANVAPVCFRLGDGVGTRQTEETQHPILALGRLVTLRHSALPPRLKALVGRLGNGSSSVESSKH